MKLFKAIIISGLALATFFGTEIIGVSPNEIALAAEKNQDQTQKTGLVFKQKDLVKVKEELQKYNVDNETINKLISKLKNQEPLDSMLYDTDQAVNVDKIDTSTGYEEVFTFADGSITVTGVELADKISSPGTITTKGTGIEGGSCSGGSGYVNCNYRKVYYLNPGVWEISFRANYTYVNGGYDYISWAGDQSVWEIYGSIGSPSCRIIRSKETSFNKAEARFSVYLYIGGSYGTLTRSVSLIVGGDSAYARGNTYY
ncbi:hypothetical protein [Niallia sp. 01092]|uniref:hypothetical protein n=1 Tax=unclassified Niallia TaxID=2837522 RepID=UPI003FCF9B6C